MQNKRITISIILILVTIAISFGLPKPKYQSPQMVSKLSIPASWDNWRSEDISSSLNTNDTRYNFINQVFARSYLSKYGANLLFLILDAGNFHNPKVCFHGAGFKARELPDIALNYDKRSFKAQAIFFEKPAGSLLVIYWICIDKKLVDWTRQKWIQFWYSLFNRQKVGLMVRLDIPATSTTIDQAISLAQEFILQISSQIPAEQQEFIFGE